MLESGSPPMMEWNGCSGSLACGLRTSGADMDGTATAGGEGCRVKPPDALRSAEEARLCSGDTGTWSNLSLFSLFIRLKVSGRGSPGTTFLLERRCIKPWLFAAWSPLEGGLAFSSFWTGWGVSLVGETGSSSLFSQLPIFWKFRRSQTLLCSPTSVLALCLLRLLLDSPLSGATKLGMFVSGQGPRSLPASRLVGTR